MDGNFDLGLNLSSSDSNGDEEPGTDEHDADVVDVDKYQEHLHAYIDSKRNRETVRKTSRDIKKFNEWIQLKNEKRALERIPPTILDVYIGEYILSLKKKDGSEYEPGSLSSTFGSIKRYLDGKNYEKDISTAFEFQTSRKVLAAKKKELKSKGLGNKPNKAEPLSRDDEELLWSSGALGHENPKALRSTVWFLTSKFCGFRGRQEIRSMTVGDLKIKRDAEGAEYIQFNERATKTRQGDQGHVRAFAPKMWCDRNAPSRCPIFIMREYFGRRPLDMMDDNSPLLLSINYKRSATSEVWYSRQPMGLNEIGKIMPEMAKKAGLPGKITNHSIRKTTCSRLLHGGVAPTVVAQLSGHRNVASLNAYAVASEKQQKDMFKILCSSDVDSARLPAIEQPRRQISAALGRPDEKTQEVTWESMPAIQYTVQDDRADEDSSQSSLAPTQPYTVDEMDDDDDEGAAIRETMMQLETTQKMMMEKKCTPNEMEEKKEMLKGMINLSNISGNITFNIKF